MHLHRLINITFLFFSIGLIAQEEDTAAYKIEHKYHTEYSPYFTFEKFQRGELKFKLSERLDSLNSKPKTLWSRKDSFNFAQSNLLMGNYRLSEHYFNSLDFAPGIHPKENIHHLVSHYVYGEFQEGLTLITEMYPRIIRYNQIYFIKQMYVAKLAYNQDKNWYKKDGDVFRFRLDSNLKNLPKKDERFQKEVIEPVKKASQILRVFVLYIYEDDPIMACAFSNLGRVLEDYVSLSQAYIAYSIGRQYNKKDKQILENIKRVKAKLNQKNYKIPNFRKYFPKTEKGRFDYDILKEKILEEKIDTIPKHKPKLLDKKEKVIDFPFPLDLIKIIGIAIVFLLLLLFLRVKKR
ncbi:MAG: hypothetical protein ACWA41_08210 [Putridiphycobacter sp.]